MSAGCLKRTTTKVPSILAHELWPGTPLAENTAKTWRCSQRNRKVMYVRPTMHHGRPDVLLRLTCRNARYNKLGRKINPSAHVNNLVDFISSPLTSLSRQANPLRLSRWQQLVPRIGGLEPELMKLSDEQLRKRSLSLRYRAKSGEPLSPPAGRGLCPGARGRPADAQHAALRRADPRRHRHVPPLDRRDADGRRQDAHRHAAAVSARAGGQGLPPGHGQRLPGPPRRRVDGARSIERWA